MCDNHIGLSGNFLWFENFSSNHQIFLDHQNIYFNGTFTEIAWKPVNNCDLYVYSTRSYICSPTENTVTNSWSTSDTMILLLNDKSRNVFFNITCALNSSEITVSESFLVNTSGELIKSYTL